LGFLREYISSNMSYTTSDSRLIMTIVIYSWGPARPSVDRMLRSHHEAFVLPAEGVLSSCEVSELCKTDSIDGEVAYMPPLSNRNGMSLRFLFSFKKR